MKTSREHKRLIARARAIHGKHNGVIGKWWFDRAEFIWKDADRKRNILAHSKKARLIEEGLIS